MTDNPPEPNRLQLTFARLFGEEGDPRDKSGWSYPYNDATGHRVTCKTAQPPGNLTIGRGINLENGIDRHEEAFITAHRLELVHEALSKFAWYTALDEVRGSVFLDLGYNDGVGGLLHFTSTIHYATVKDWPNCRAALLDSKAAQDNPRRYRPLAALLFSGA